MDVLEQAAEEAGWGRERVVAVGIVIGFLPALCFLWSVFRLLRCLCCDADLCRCHAFGYALCALGQALLAGLVVGFVAHFVPCFWLSCDLKEGDNGGLRLALWIGVGLGTAALFLLCFYSSCCSSPVCVMRVRGNSKRYTRTGVVGNSNDV